MPRDHTSIAECPCFADISAKIQIPDIAHIIQEYVHDARSLADYGLNDFELHVRHSKYRGSTWVSTNGAWMQTSVPREIPYVEIRISPWNEVYDALGVQTKSATHLKVDFTYAESTTRTYASSSMIIKIATKQDREYLLETLFAKENYESLIAKIKWGKVSGWKIPAQKLVQLREQFHEVCAGIRTAIKTLEIKVRHTGMPALLCYTR